ncbi:MAG TPA: hypothetical protein VH000_06025 [Rhizomicrobium sp.]|jgi:hypothetical protein|nr:hypothetical protein [Rhizomicrobium sp.]
MTKEHGNRRLSFFVLCLGLLVATVLFSAPVFLQPAIRWALSAGLLAVIGIATWKAGLAQMGAAPDSGRMALTAAALLIFPLALAALMPGFGPPQFADHTQNVFRYIVLFIDAVFVFCGMTILHDVLRASGERLYSRLGLALILAATPLYLVWAGLLLEEHRAALAGNSWAGGPWNTWLMSFADVLLFFAGLLTYLATALFALSLKRTQWIGAKASIVFVALNFTAALCLIARGIDFPDPTLVFAQGYSVPGWIAGIPAIPWFMPGIFGLILLRRTARQQLVALS